METEGTTLTTRSEPYHETAIHARVERNQTRMMTVRCLSTDMDWTKMWAADWPKSWMFAVGVGLLRIDGV